MGGMSSTWRRRGGRSGGQALRLLVLVGALGSARAQSADEGWVVDEVVAEVEDTLITRSDLVLEAHVMLVQRSGAAGAWVDVDDALLSGVLELSLAQRLQAREADRLGSFTLEPAERSALLEAFGRHFPSEQEFRTFLERHGVDAGQLAALLERNVRAERALDSRLRVRAQVTEAEVRRAYEARRDSLGGAAYAEVRGRLREELMRENYRRATEEELAALERSARVRRISPLARRERKEVPR